jgi:outer membrane protein, heavy metal efflux system
MPAAGSTAKANSALDRRAGEFGVAAADYRIAGARHSAVQLLNDIWWDWLAAGAEIKANEAAVANLTADLTSVERRVALQDAAPVDADRARSALATARAALEQSRSRG